jgi:hypothetical protein
MIEVKRQWPCLFVKRVIRLNEGGSLLDNLKACGDNLSYLSPGLM